MRCLLLRRIFFLKNILLWSVCEAKKEKRVQQSLLVHGRKCAAFQHGWCRPCWTARALEEATSSLIQAFSPPSSKGFSSGGHFLFLLLLVFPLSYSLYTLVNIFSSGYFIPLCLCDLSVHCIRIHSLWAFAITQCSSCLSWGAYRESLGDHFSLYKWFLYFDILPPFIFMISMFDIIAHRLFIGSIHVTSTCIGPNSPRLIPKLSLSLCASCICILCLYSVFFHLLFLFIPHAYFLRIFPLYPCMHPDVIHYPSPSVWRAL